MEQLINWWKLQGSGEQSHQQDAGKEAREARRKESEKQAKQQLETAKVRSAASHLSVIQPTAL